MTNSELSDELFNALSKAQAEVLQPKKEATNPHFKSKYATLDAIQDVARAPLAKNGLAVIDSLESEGDDYYCESWLTHSSGQWVFKKTKLLLFKRDMQGLGSAFTYGRRYNLMGFMNVFGDNDDDGNAASIPIQAQGVPKEFREAKALNEQIEKIKVAPPPDDLSFLNESENPAMYDLGEYSVPFGKWNGQLLKNLKPTEVLDYIKYLQDTAQREKKVIQGKVLEFIEISMSYFGLQK